MWLILFALLSFKLNVTGIPKRVFTIKGKIGYLSEEGILYIADSTPHPIYGGHIPQIMREAASDGIRLYVLTADGVEILDSEGGKIGEISGDYVDFDIGPVGLLLLEEGGRKLRLPVGTTIEFSENFSIVRYAGLGKCILAKVEKAYIFNMETMKMENLPIEVEDAVEIEGDLYLLSKGKVYRYPDFTDPLYDEEIVYSIGKKGNSLLLGLEGRILEYYPKNQKR